MQQAAKQIAEHATFQAFMNSYLREVNEGQWRKKEEWIKEQRPSILMTGEEVVELALSEQNVRLAFCVDYRSLVGRHRLGVSLKYCPKENCWHPEDKLTVIITLIQELHLIAKSNGCHELASHYDELILRLIESYQTMTNYIQHRMQDPNGLASEKKTFIEAEQSLLFGHWLHPTPKSRQGMASWQQVNFAPELQGSFQLHYFKVDRQIVNEASILQEQASEIIAQAVKNAKPSIEMPVEACFIPVHPLQAQWLLQQEHVKKAIAFGLIEDVGTMGPSYTATSSIRTVYSPTEEWMYKFSIPVKITNSLRVNRNHELRAGIVMARLMKKINFLENDSSFQIIADPAYMTVDLPGQTESGFEVIFRSNVFKEGQDEGITMLAALVQEPFPGQKSRLHQLITAIAKSESRSIEDVSLRWFSAYWKCAIEPLLRLYDEHGIALEAHQQNSVLDISAGYPTTYYYRDNQGYYLSKAVEGTLRAIEPTLAEAQELFYEDALIQERFTYYLFMNQLFSVIHRFGADQLIDENILLAWSIEQLRLLEQEFTDQGKVFIQTILTQEKLAFKANLLTRFHDVDELAAELEQAVYTKIPNPFALNHKEEEYATATVFSY